MGLCVKERPNILIIQKELEDEKNLTISQDDTIPSFLHQHIFMFVGFFKWMPSMMEGEGISVLSCHYSTLTLGHTYF